MISRDTEGGRAEGLEDSVIVLSRRKSVCSCSGVKKEIFFLKTRSLF